MKRDWKDAAGSYHVPFSLGNAQNKTPNKEYETGLQS